MLDNTFIVDKKLKSQSEMFYPLTLFPKVPLFVTLKLKLETEDVTEELQELQLLLLDILKMELRPELDYHLVQEK